MSLGWNLRQCSPGSVPVLFSLCFQHVDKVWCWRSESRQKWLSPVGFGWEWWPASCTWVGSHENLWSFPELRDNRIPGWTEDRIWNIEEFRISPSLGHGLRKGVLSWIDWGDYGWLSIVWWGCHSDVPWLKQQKHILVTVLGSSTTSLPSSPCLPLCCDHRVVPSFSLRSSDGSSYKDITEWGLSSTHMTSFHFVSLKGVISTYRHILK